MDAYNDFDNTNNRWGTISSISEYKENVAYDPNGNITYYKRNGSGGSPFTNNMDILNYAYVPNTNKLKHVQDAVDASYYANDIDNQTRYGVNYLSDATGNMVTDSAEHLHIYWNNYGKLDSTFNWNSGVAMKFIYDPSGNRIEKRFYSVPGNYSKRTNTYYIRDAQGNILANYVFKNDDTLSLTELDIYGSSRLGVLNADTILYDAPNICNGCRSFVPSPLTAYWLGKKQYELTNHLGNVLTTITDKKIPVDINGNGVADYYLAEVSSQNDYYPFGMSMPGRSYTGKNYRFGFNGFEKDDEIKGIGNHISFADYGYDSRLGRRMNVDPIIFSWQGSYTAFNNNPILFVDPSGKGAEVSAQKDDKGKVTAINIKARVFVHGKDADKAVDLIKKDMSEHLKDNPELKGTWGRSRNVQVNFDISVESVDDQQLAEKQEEHETDKSINIVEMDDNSGYNGSGKFDLSLENQQNRGNTFSHEFFHMLGFNSGEEGDESHFSELKDGKPKPLMYSGQGGSEILKQRVVTNKDVSGLRNQQGFRFYVSPDKSGATKIIEYSNPAGPHPFNNGEKYKK